MRHPPGSAMVQRARRLRRDMTDAETLLWSHLRAGQLGVKFRRQMWLGGHVADFASVEAKLVIEVDGGQHDRDREKDERRAAAMSALGYRTLRFWNNDVLKNVDGVLQMISAALPSPSHAAAPRGPLQHQVRTAPGCPQPVRGTGGLMLPKWERDSEARPTTPSPVRGEGGAHRASDGRVRE